ncbi:MAG: S46 family peptidase, partial [Acidobacteriota bacterium]
PAANDPKNVPYRPRNFYPVSAQGIEPGAFVMVPGYPGLTYRSLTEAEMRERAELYFPRRAQLYRAWMDLMEAASATGEEARIALADRLKGLANREKNSRGQVDGLRRGHILDKKHAAEQAVLAWAAGRPDQKEAVAAQAELAKLAAQKRATWDRDFLLEQAKLGSKSLDLALTLVRRAGEATKPDLDREPDYMDREKERLEERLRLDQKRMHLPTEQALLVDLLVRFAALPAGSRVAAVETYLDASRDPAAVRVKVADLFARTRVNDPEERAKMFNESIDQLRARHDPLLDLAFALDLELRSWKERDDRAKGTVSRLRPRWQRAVIAHAAHTGQPVAFDANGTLRVALAHVGGYTPRDAVRMEPQTTVAGVVEKYTGADPFNAPRELLAAAPSARSSRWADRRLNDVPVGFLADADTTGGNSGSPVLNGRGELV